MGSGLSNFAIEYGRGVRRPGLIQTILGASPPQGAYVLRSGAGIAYVPNPLPPAQYGSTPTHNPNFQQRYSFKNSAVHLCMTRCGRDTTTTENSRCNGIFMLPSCHHWCSCLLTLLRTGGPLCRLSRCDAGSTRAMSLAQI